MTMSSIDTANKWYASIHAGDFDSLFNLIDDDCVIEYQGPSIIPFAGIFTGKEKCKLFFGHVAEDVEIREFCQDEFITEGDKVAVTGHLELVLKITGGIYASDYVHILDIKNGKVVRFRDFQDTAKAMIVSLNIDTPVR